MPISDNSDLSLRIDDDGLKARPLTADGFAFTWSGARSMYGADKGKVAFEVKVRLGECKFYGVLS